MCVCVYIYAEKEEGGRGVGRGECGWLHSKLSQLDVSLRIRLEFIQADCLTDSHSFEIASY